MNAIRKFDRCIYCFAVKTHSGSCRVCGYENGLCDPPFWQLMPGTILKGRYMAGCLKRCTDSELIYLGWDLKTNQYREIAEYFPREWVTRDITHSAAVSCIPRFEQSVEQGRREFGKRFPSDTRRTQLPGYVTRDVFFRNNTCYYVDLPWL